MVDSNRIKEFTNLTAESRYLVLVKYNYYKFQ